MFTPALLLNVAKLEANGARMRKAVASRGLDFRPHFKTAKCIEALPFILDPANPRLTVSTLAEAEAGLGAGIRDILYAVGVAPNKIRAIGDLLARGANLAVLVDCLDAVRALCGAFSGANHRPRVMIEIDTDGHRAGLAPDAPDLLALAGALDGLDLAGVMTHAGESYLGPNPEGARAYAEREAQGASEAARRLRAAGHAVPIVSVGSSPTATFPGGTHDVTEMRAGVYALGDLFMANLGVVAPSDIALSCLVTVIGHQIGRNWILTDGGWTALSQDRSTANQAVDWNYGRVCDEDGNQFENLVVVKANQEHGILSTRDGTPVPDLPWGSRLRILPNHACAMADQHRVFHALRPEGVEVWRRVEGWAPTGVDT